MPFHLAADVGNVPALNELLGRENTEFDKLTGDGENAYDVAVSRFGSPSKSPEHWGVPDSMEETHIEERDLTTMQILDIIYDDVGLKPKKTAVTIYPPKEDYVVIIPPRGGEIKTWVASIEDVIAIPGDTQDLVLSKIRALSSGRSFFLATSDEIAHMFAEHIAYAIQEHVPQLDERVGQVLNNQNNHSPAQCVIPQSPGSPHRLVSEESDSLNPGPSVDPASLTHGPSPSAPGHMPTVLGMAWLCRRRSNLSPDDSGLTGFTPHR